MNTELIKLDEVLPLVEIYKTHKEKYDKAKAVCELSLSGVNAIRLSDRTITPAFIEKLFESPRNIRRLAGVRKKEFNEARTPYTQKMDAMKSLCTAIENGYENIASTIALKENEWEREKLLINKEAEDAKALLLKQAQDLILRKGALRGKLLIEYGKSLGAKLVAMNFAFNAKTAKDLPLFGEALKAWNPIMKNEEWTAIATAAIIVDDADIQKEVVDAIWPELSEKWKASIDAERNRLVELVPARVKELQTPVQTSIPVNIPAYEAVTEVKDLIQAEEANTDVAVMSAGFVTVSAKPLEQAKGSVKKNMYVAKTHKAVAAIIQAYVINDLNKMSIEDATKKFSFCFTAANSRLNDKKDPVVIKTTDGLDIVEDVRTKAIK